MTRVLTGPAAQATSLDEWLASGGGEGLRTALAKPAEIIPLLDTAGLRGMGGAGFPAHIKWAAVAAEAGADKWVIANGNEDEPGTFKDRFLLEHTPHPVIEGVLIAALATGAANAVIYANPRETAAIEALERAVAEWAAHALFAAVSTATGQPLRLTVQASAGLYVGGEETGAIAAVAGGFPFPRHKPPWPAQQGVHGQPTLVNNVETLALAANILRHGADWFHRLGRTAPGTTLYSLSGDILRPGLHELPMGTPLRELIHEHGGGMLADKPFKAVFTGGPSNTLLTPADLDVALDFDSLKARGSRLGTGAMIVVGEGTSIVRRTAEYVSFFAASSCGQCPPCKVGTYQVARILERIEEGAGHPDDLQALENLAGLLPGSGRCGLVDGAATVLASSLSAFRDEYERAIAIGTPRD